MKTIVEALIDCFDNEKIYYINNDNEYLIVVNSHITIWSKNADKSYSLKNKIFYNYNFIDSRECNMEVQLFSSAMDNLIAPNDEVRAKYGDFRSMRFKRCFDVNIPTAIVDWNKFFTSALNKYDELSLLRSEVCFSKYWNMEHEYLQLLFDDGATDVDISNYMKLIDKEYIRRLSNESECRYFN